MNLCRRKYKIVTKNTDNEKKTSQRKYIVITLIVILFLIIVFTLIFSFIRNYIISKSYEIFFKNGEIVYINYYTEVEKQISNDLLNGHDFINSNVNMLDFQNFIKISNDKKRIFFCDSEMSLYCYKTNETMEYADKIDSNITEYSIDKNGKSLIYLKNSDLYFFNLQKNKKQRIAKNVSAYKVSKDFKKVDYRTLKNDCFLWYPSTQKSVQWANNISTIEYISKDLTTFYYTINNSLYRYHEGEKKSQKIAADVTKVLTVYETGEVYYMKTSGQEQTFMNFVSDDFAEKDAMAQEPKLSSYDFSEQLGKKPVREDFSSESDYLSALGDYEASQYYLPQKEHTAWYRDFCIYEDTIYRDSLRQTLSGENIKPIYSLYYSNGTKETLVCENVLFDEEQIQYAANQPVISFQKYEPKEIEKTKLSEIIDLDEFYNRIYQALYGKVDQCVAVKEKLIVANWSNVDEIFISPGGTTIYYLDRFSGYDLENSNTDDENPNKGKLYQISIVGQTIEQPKLYADNISIVAPCFLQDNSIVYYKNTSEKTASGNEPCMSGDLYMGKTLIDYDVLFVNHLEKIADTIFYLIDFDKKTHVSTLMTYHDGERTKIADDVYDFRAISDKNIVYLHDYENDTHTLNGSRSTLSIYHNGETKPLAYDVFSLQTSYSDYASLYGPYLFELLKSHEEQLKNSTTYLPDNLFSYEGMPVLGKWYIRSGFDEGYETWLHFFADSTFILHINFLEGFSVEKGEYEIDQNGIIRCVIDRDNSFNSEWVEFEMVPQKEEIHLSSSSFNFFLGYGDEIFRR